MTWSEALKTGFLAMRPIFSSSSELRFDIKDVKLKLLTGM